MPCSVSHEGQGDASKAVLLRNTLSLPLQPPFIEGESNLAKAMATFLKIKSEHERSFGRAGLWFLGWGICIGLKIVKG